MTERQHIDRTPGRRGSDQVCPLHDILHGQNHEDHQGICGKVGKAMTDIMGLEKSKAGRTEFYWMVGIVIATVVTVVGASNTWLRSDLKDGQIAIHSRLSKITDNSEMNMRSIAATVQSLDSSMQVLNHRVLKIEEQLNRESNLKWGDAMPETYHHHDLYCSRLDVSTRCNHRLYGQQVICRGFARHGLGRRISDNLCTWFRDLGGEHWICTNPQAQAWVLQKFKEAE